MLKRFRNQALFISLLMVTFILTGCFGGGTKTEQVTLDITVKLAEGGEGQLKDVLVKVDNKAMDKSDTGKYSTKVDKDAKVPVSIVLEGYVTYDKTHTFSKNDTLDVVLELAGEEPELPTDKEIEEAIAAVNQAAGAGNAEDFYEALSDPALGLVDVIEEYATVYLGIAKDGEEAYIQAVTFMDTPQQIQENVIYPGNRFVDDVLNEINTAKNALVRDKNVLRLLDEKVLSADDAIFGEEEEKIIDEFFLVLFDAASPFVGVAELQAVFTAYEDIMDELTTLSKAFSDADDQVKAIRALYAIADFVATLPESELKEDGNDFIKGEIDGILDTISGQIGTIEFDFDLDPEDSETKPSFPGPVSVVSDVLDDRADALKVVVELRDGAAHSDKDKKDLTKEKFLARLTVIETLVNEYVDGLIEEVNKAIATEPDPEANLATTLQEVLELTPDDDAIALFAADYKGHVFASLEEIEDAYEAAAQEAGIVADIKGGNKDALLRLGVVEYNDLKGFNRDEVAQLVLAAKPDGGFKRLAEIEKALQTKTQSYVELLAAVNAANTNTTMQAALNNMRGMMKVLVNGFDEKDAFTIDQAEDVLSARGKDAFASIEAIVEVEGLL